MFIWVPLDPDKFCVKSTLEIIYVMTTFLFFLIRLNTRKILRTQKDTASTIVRHHSLKMLPRLPSLPVMWVWHLQYVTAWMRAFSIFKQDITVQILHTYISHNYNNKKNYMITMTLRKYIHNSAVFLTTYLVIKIL